MGLIDDLTGTGGIVPVTEESHVMKTNDFSAVRRGGRLPVPGPKAQYRCEKFAGGMPMERQRLIKENWMLKKRVRYLEQENADLYSLVSDLKETIRWYDDERRRFEGADH